MKKFRKIVWCLLAVAGMFGCNCESESSAPSVQEETTVLKITHANPVGEEATCFVVQDGEGAYNRAYLISSNRKTDMNYCEVDAKIDEKGNIICNEMRLLHNIGKVEEVIIDCVVDELIPNKAIEYIDEKGKTHIACIRNDGKTGSPMLVELQRNMSE